MASPAPVRFRVHPSPVGDIVIVTTDDGIVTLHPFWGSAPDPRLADARPIRGSAPDPRLADARPIDGPLGAELERVGLALHALPVHDEEDSVADAAAEQLDEYFDGERQTFDLPLDWRLVRGFTRAALEAVCDIPYGETAGYGEVAIAAGSPRAARAVGTACATTPFSIIVPVHRVVRADGSLGEYGGRPDVKRFLIELEQAAGE